MLDLLMKRRSIRRYKDDIVPKEIVDKIVQGALTSPTGRNKKPWELVVVNDRETLNKLGTVRGRITKPMSNGTLGFVIVVDPEITDLWIEDASIIAIVIQLLVESYGLGSCWLQVRDRMNQDEELEEDVEGQVKEILNIPDNYRVEAMISVGYPNEEKSPHDVEELTFDKVHYNSF